MLMKLNTENAKVFNSSLKEAIRKLTNQKVKVRIINSYKFPNCYVEVDAETEFSNDFKLNVFDAFGNKRDGLLNVENVSYGNIQSKHITGKVFQWENLFNEINLKEFEKGGKMKEPTIVRGFSDDEPYEYAEGGGVEGEQITYVAEAIFNPNQKNGKIKLSTKGSQSLGGLKYLIADLNGEHIASVIFEANQKDGVVKTEFGDKTYGQLLAIIHHAKTNKLNFYEHKKMAKGGGVKYAKGSTVKGGSVRSLLSQFQKEKPIILIQMIADDVSSEFMRKKFDETIVWSKLSDSQKEKYNEDYRENKFEFIKYLIYEFLKLYYSNDTIKNKCKGKSRATISAIKSVMVSLAKDYPSSKMADGGMMKEDGYSSKKELKDDFKRIIQAPKTKNIYETKNDSYIGKLVTVKLPNEIKSFKTKVLNEYVDMVSTKKGIFSKKYIIKMADGGMMAMGGKINFKFKVGDIIKVPQYDGGKLKKLSAEIVRTYSAKQNDGTYYPFYYVVGKWDNATELLYDEEKILEYGNKPTKMADGGMMAKGGLLGGFNYSIGGL